eukprot:Awhi_evm1s11523
MPSIELVYFKAAGRAKAARVAFAMGKVEFTDTRLEGEQFMKLKPSLPRGQLPILKVDGEVFTESMAILRYAGTLAKLYPTDALDQLRVEEALDAQTNFANILLASFMEQDLEKKLALRKEIFEKDFPKNLSFLNEIYSRNSSGFVCDKVTIADLHVAVSLEMLTSGQLDGIPTTCADDYPNLQRLLKQVREIDEFKNYQ